MEKLLVTSIFSISYNVFERVKRVKNNYLDKTEFKVFADNILNVTKSVISVFDREENIVGKGENAGY